MTVVFKTTGGVTGVRARITGMRRRAEVPDRAWLAVGKYMAREVDKQFLTRGANFKTPWKPLATSTLMQKRKAGFPLQPLVRTGQMKRGFLFPAIVQGSRGSTATFGSTSDIAHFQHGGTRRNGRQHIPARPIIKATPEMRRDVARIMRRYIVDGET